MEKKQKSGFATAALVLGIIGICLSFIPIINNVAFVLGILAVIFGIIALIKKSSKGKSIVSIILGILAIVISINMQQSMSKALDELSDNLDTAFGNKTDEILENSADVILGDFEVIEGEWMTDTRLVVKVTNKTSETKSFSIQIEAVNEDGSRINNDYVYANNLGAGQSQNFETFTYITSDKIEAMRNATFKIVEISMY